MKTIVVLGNDGYIGHALTLRLLNQGYKVIGIDNTLRRHAVEAMYSFSATPIISVAERVETYNKIGDFYFHFENLAEFNSYPLLRDVFNRHEPECIVNLAQMPSAPYSQISVDHAVGTAINNIASTINVLWAMKDFAPDAQLVQIGTMGEYAPDIGVDIEEGYMTMNVNNNTEKSVIFPRQGGSFYHTSKISATYFIEYACRVYNIHATDIMQGIVYGNWTPEIEQYNSHTRLDSDECLISGSKILSNFSYKNIENITIGNKVFTHLGNIKNVNKIFNRPYNGNIISIKYQYNRNSLKVTPNHPLLITEYNRNKKAKYDMMEPRWISAESLQALYDNKKKTDNIFVLVPKLKIDKIDKIIDVYKEIGYGVIKDDIVYSPNPMNEEKIANKNQGVSRYIKVDKSFMKIVGYYLAEGNSGDYHIAISFGKHEKDLIKDFKNNFSFLTVNEYKKGRLQINSIIFSRLFGTLFGRDSYTKKLPDWALYLNDDLIKALLKGYWLGDGSGSNNIVEFTSVSKKLLEQIQILLYRFGIVSTLNECERNNVLNFKNRDVYKHESIIYQLVLSRYSARKFYRNILDRKVEEPQRKTYHWKDLDDYMALPIRSVTKEKYNGRVYNLEVDDDESYLTPISVHNCFGTVVNRFIVQTVLEHPLTIYGEGKHKRGFLALNDSIQCLMLAIENGDYKGYRVWNQLDTVHTMLEVADMVKRAGEKIGYSPDIEFIETPRVENTGDFYYNPIVEKLKALGFKPTRSIYDEALFAMSVLKGLDIGNLSRVVYPTIKWRKDRL